jgi:DEAD/DEAH box helicase domain-containing protein
VTLPDQELHTTAVWWQLPQAVLDAGFIDRQQALDGFMGAASALHLVATVAVMAESRDLQKSVGSGDGAWFVSADEHGHGRLRGSDGGSVEPGPDLPFAPTVYLYDAFPGGVGLSEPLFARRDELLARALELVHGCDCRGGCPACVGPVLATDESATHTAKMLALQVLKLLAQG